MKNVCNALKTRFSSHSYFFDLLGFIFPPKTPSLPLLSLLKSNFYS
uniref:Uncharacterized protein n=1 Tax=Rhizophora mucronata TaxID=61149 RepID=A0A2P2L6Z1_RHIMU